MTAASGIYSKDIFSEWRRYWAPLLQESKPAAPIPLVDADWNDGWRNFAEIVRRYRYEVFGDGTPGTDHWQIIQSVISNVNNFTIDGGGGTVEDASRYYLGGFMSTKPSPIEFDPNSAPVPTDDMDYVDHRSSALTNVLLTDTDANYVVNELVGRLLVPNVSDPVLTSYAVTANTATTITTAGPMLALASAGDYYVVLPSTPAGNRTDRVYLDVHLEEWDATEDTNLLHSVIGGPPGGIEACRRLKLVQQVHVKEGGAAYADATYVSAAGNRHYRELLATFARLLGNNTITTAMITDNRPYTLGYGSSQEVIAARTSTVYSTTYTSLDARLEVAEDDAFDAHNFIDDCRVSGTLSGGVCTDGGGGIVNYTAWSGYVEAELITVVGGAFNVGALGAGTYYLSVNSAGAVVSAGVFPVTNALLCRVEVNGVPIVTDLRDFRFFIRNLDYHDDIIVEESTTNSRSNLESIQTAIDYAIFRGYNTIRVRGDNTAYTISAPLVIDQVGAAVFFNPSNIHIIFEKGAIITPDAGFNVFEIDNASDIIIEGLNVDGTNMGVGDAVFQLANVDRIQIIDSYIDGAGIGIEMVGAVTNLEVKSFYWTALQADGIVQTVGGSPCYQLSVREGYIDAIGNGIVWGTAAGATAYYGVVEHVRFGSAFTGIMVHLDSFSFQCAVRDCVLQNAAGLTEGIRVEGDKHVLDNIISPQSTIGGTGLVNLVSTASKISIVNCQFENVTGAYPIYIAGEDVTISNCVFDQGAIAQHCVYLSTVALNVHVDSCLFMGGGAYGIYVDDASYTSVIGCYFYELIERAIYMNLAHHCIVEGCTFNNIDDNGAISFGIDAVACDYLVVNGNTFRYALLGTAFAVSLGTNGVGCDGVAVSGNTIEMNADAASAGIRIGTAAASTNNVVVTGNTIIFAAATPAGVSLVHCSSVSITGNVFETAASGVTNFGASGDTNHIVINDNVMSQVFTCVSLNGVAHSIADILIDGNNINNATTYGVYIASGLGYDVVISNNQIRSAGVDGILIDTASNKQVSGNNIALCADEGIELVTVTQSLVNGNFVRNSGGTANVYVHTNSDNNVISNNVCNDATQYGIYLSGGDSNALNGNHCYSNTLSGILLGTCDYNTLCGNMARDNGVHGIHINPGNFNSICGNSVYSNTTDGIHLVAGAQNNAVSGNVGTGNVQDMNNLGVSNGLGVAGGANNVSTYNKATNMVG